MSPTEVRKCGLVNVPLHQVDFYLSCVHTVPLILSELVYTHIEPSVPPLSNPLRSISRRTSHEWSHLPKHGARLCRCQHSDAQVVLGLRQRCNILGCSGEL